MEGRLGSYWLATAERRRHAPLTGERRADVAVVGGGIAGLTAAWLLKRAGKTVVVLEAGRILERVTGGTTAKISALHGLRYAELIDHFGVDGARLYAQANLGAIERVAEAVAELGVDCGFERKSAYLFSASGAALPQVEAEVDAALKLGLRVSFVREAPLPIPIKGAVRLDGQAQFHPVRYLAAMAEAICGDGSAIHEDSRVFDVAEGEPCRVATEHGAVQARDVIVATNLPILDRGGFFAKAYPKMHAVLAARIDEAAAPDGMFLGMDEPELSLRTHRDEQGLVLISDGRAFKTGHEPDVEGVCRELEAELRRWFELRSIEFRWSNQDYGTMDGAPYFGRQTPGDGHVYVATGFNHWGMTSSMVGARLLRDEILERANPCAELFRATRLKPAASAGTFAKENLDVAKHWVGDRLSGDRRGPDQLAAGEGAVLKVGGSRVAVSRDEAGRLQAVSCVCTHMGCTVAWNGLDKTWDCPCHGSRVAADGAVLCGPAVRPLEKKPVHAEAEP